MNRFSQFDRALIISVALLALAALAAPAAAAFIDDMNYANKAEFEAVWPAFWWGDSSGYTASFGTQVDIEDLGLPPGGSGTGWLGGNLSCTKTLAAPITGDFTITARISFNRFGSGTTEMAEQRLILLDSSDAVIAMIGMRDTTNRGYGYPIGEVGGAWYDGTAFPYENDVAELSITRTGAGANNTVVWYKSVGGNLKDEGKYGTTSAAVAKIQLYHFSNYLDAHWEGIISDTFGTYSWDKVQEGEIPEPGTLVLLGMGLISMLIYAWRRRR